HGDGDAAGIEVGRGGRRLDRELPVNRRQAGIEGAPGRNGAGGLRLGGRVDRTDELAAGKQGDRPREGGQAKYHLGVYPCLPLNTKPDGSRSSRVAMTFRLAVGGGSSRRAP